MENTPAKNMTMPIPTDMTTTNASARFTTGGLPKPVLKWRRILRAMLDGNLNRFHAGKHGDHCLNSTVAELRRDHLVSIDWVWEEVPSLSGSATSRVRRYCVDRDPVNMGRARNLLGLAS